jgi:hypothetical protein
MAEWPEVRRGQVGNMQQLIFDEKLLRRFGEVNTTVLNAVYMIGMIAMISVDQLYARRKPIDGPVGAIGARIGPIGSTCARDCAWPCICADRPSQFLCMHRCPPAQNGFADSHK